MLGLGNTRVNQLEAENRRLRAELLAQTQRADAQSRITPTTQEIAERAAQRLRSRPVSEYVVPVPPTRPTLVDSTTGDDEDDDEYQDSEIGF